MKDPAIAIKDYLNGKATFNLNVGAFPATPDEAVLVTSSGGQNPYPHLALNFPSVQVLVRGKASGYVAASDEIRSICNFLLGFGNITINTDVYRSCNQLGDVIYLGQDNNSRPMFSANFWFIVEPSDLGNRKAIT